ncbi:MAG: hypothetical protein ACFE9R_00005, partial [Candidatus Hermodarchaeota archaeon]
MTIFELENEFWSLIVRRNDNNSFNYELKSKKNGVVYADEDYHYSITTASKRGSRFAYLPHVGA